MRNLLTDPAPQQLDIFADSRDVMLRNDLVQALLERDALTGARASARLAHEYPGDALLAPATTLLSALVESQSPDTPLADAEALSAAQLHLSADLAPAALAALGAAHATPWLASLCCRLAQRAAHLPWLGAQPEDHACALWLAGSAWAQAEQAAAGIASWRRIPVPLAWMVQARYRQHGVDGIWPLLAELAWLAPARFGALLRTLADPLLMRLQRRFDGGFDPAGMDPREGDQAMAWFPAWLLTDTPALAPRLALAEPGQDTPPERGMRLMVQLLGLERQGRHHELVALRKVLRDLSPPLYLAYMATR